MVIPLDHAILELPKRLFTADNYPGTIRDHTFVTHNECLNICVLKTCEVNEQCPQ